MWQRSHVADYHFPCNTFTCYLQVATDATVSCHAPFTRADLGNWLHVCAVYDGASWTMCAKLAFALQHVSVNRVTILTCTKTRCQSLQRRRIRASSGWMAGGHVAAACGLNYYDSVPSLSTSCFILLLYDCYVVTNHSANGASAPRVAAATACSSATSLTCSCGTSPSLKLT